MSSWLGQLLARTITSLSQNKARPLYVEVDDSKMKMRAPPTGGDSAGNGRPRGETILDLTRFMVRLTDLNDFDLRSAQAMALRFVRNAAHIHNQVAQGALVKIEDEIRRRADNLWNSVDAT